MAASDSQSRRSWPLDVMGSKYLAVRARDLRANEVALPVQAASVVIERAMMHPNDIAQLSDLGHALARSGFRSMSTVNWQAVLKAFSSGQMVLLKRNVLIPSTRLSTDESVSEQLQSAKQVKTWVEMEVVDMEGNPVPNKNYLCVLPDGSVQEGVLDRTGKVRFDDIDPGNCSFMLTELDREAWDRVS